MAKKAVKKTTTKKASGAKQSTAKAIKPKPGSAKLKSVVAAAKKVSSKPPVKKVNGAKAKKVVTVVSPPAKKVVKKPEPPAAPPPPSAADIISAAGKRRGGSKLKKFKCECCGVDSEQRPDDKLDAKLCEFCYLAGVLELDMRENGENEAALLELEALREKAVAAGGKIPGYPKPTLPKQSGSRGPRRPEPEVTGAAAAAAVDTRKSLGNPGILKRTPDAPYVALNEHRETAIVVSREDGTVRYVPFNTAELLVYALDEEIFDRDFSPCDYPVQRAASLYNDAANHILTSESTKQTLRQIMSGSYLYETKELNMSKKEADAAAAKAAKNVVEKKAGKKAGAKVESAKKEKGEGAGRGRPALWKGKKIKVLSKDLAKAGVEKDTPRFERFAAVLKCKTADEALALGNGISGKTLQNMSEKFGLIQLV